MVTQISLGLVELFFIARLGVDALAGVSQVFLPDHSGAFQRTWWS